ncbi:MAG: tRNA (adenosine(37)-N6)-threonylcarbamoyltransferase complex dimerization subunit type 1 TsaB [Candidatus Omnitrophica bacterium]|nr:tRNA (adenosine(37)-N6)-threonylcarbamoyltransferase complex dimerization subunit type 1 TsaB [Candidatus Omnitrophota bacterium]MBU1128402.1 tRNA (adenosine(37)-N6)-threonylcarbamoyltransferase complex dimerization subunit type 1 TsaB [Candidatus Omnitrophota bacterium]MBU1657070.1 tRNA (adenosine(37)-N6)-threonylcarbamoyltransferase complex dimerization subunit type 1 TsaB [Candidatus Omnitrophota bacterium]MBU1784740.1 tRNA (adenosine(37)-N6)-threonylcarbamoyltransferase complex dimerizati
MKTLAFDTSTKFLSIALLEGDRLIAESHEEAGIRHSELLVPVIKDMLDEAGWKVDDIGLIAVGLGPGSFTGLRIAAATAKGMVAATGSKVIGVPSMDAMVRNFTAGGKKKLIPLIDARKEKVYVCIYDYSGQEPARESDYMLVSIDDFLLVLRDEAVFFGDAVMKYKEKLDACPRAGYIEDIDWYPRASWIGRIGMERARHGTDDPDTLEPLYLHAKECNVVNRG